MNRLTALSFMQIQLWTRLFLITFGLYRMMTYQLRLQSRDASSLLGIIHQKNLNGSVLWTVFSPVFWLCSSQSSTDTTVTASTGRWTSTAPAESTGWTAKSVLTRTTAPILTIVRAQTTTSRRHGTPTATTQTGSRSTGHQPVGPVHPETSAPLTTHGHPWATGHPLITRPTTRARRSRSGAAARHNGRLGYPSLA